MRLSMKVSLYVVLLMVLMPSLFAQLPDPFDPHFSPKHDILTAKIAKEHHVKSCIIYKNGEHYNTLIFNNRGEIIRDGKETYFTILNEKGWKEICHCFDEYKYYGKIEYEMTPYGDLKKVYETYVSSLNKITKNITYTYAKGLLASIDEKYKNEMAYYYSFTNTTYTYTYNTKRQLEKMKIHDESGSYSVFNNEPTTFSEDSLIYKNGKLISSSVDDAKLKYYYNDKGQLNLITQLSDGVSGEIPIYQYEYYEKGLLKSTQEILANKWTYEYEYFDPATLMIEIPDQYNEISLWNFSQNSDHQNHKIKNNHIIAKIMVPELEFYIVKLTAQLNVPLIVQPGTKIFMSADNNGIFYAKEDSMNTYALNLEKAKHEAYSRFQGAEAQTAFSNYIILEIKKHPKHPAFMLYADYWDLNNHKDLFKTYTKIMDELYPNNFKIKEAYVSLKDQ